MTKILLVVFSFIATAGFSQSGYYFHPKGDGDKYFVALGYGQGTAHWSSLFKSTEFYDKDGRVINTGDLEFAANSPTKQYDVHVLAPIKHIRLGLGISFEHHYLSQLKIYTKSGEEYLLFDESLRFDKINFIAEVPFNYESKKKYSFSWNFNCGWFGYTNVKRFNFIGEKPFPVALHGATGITVDYQLYPQVYVFAFPNVEYKYYSNSHTEAPVDITHRVFSASVIAGIRVDLGAFNY
ncbi:MAG: hypothetical protein HY841_00760 [Bacteroidetes bacterium]|nr:hypothetical protein [Bacteroidota bacterium]